MPGRPVYTAAFILAAPSVYGHRAKHRNHLALVADMFRPSRLGVAIARARTLEDVYDSLIAYPAIGPFLAYQIAVDLNYSDLLAFSENNFTVPGPGAERGLQKVFRDSGSQSPRQLIMRMVDRQDEEFQRLGLDFPGLFGRPLHAIDCQGLFCETDKYSREAFPSSGATAFGSSRSTGSHRMRCRSSSRRSGESMIVSRPPKRRTRNWTRSGMSNSAWPSPSGSSRELF